MAKALWQEGWIEDRRFESASSRFGRREELITLIASVTEHRPSHEWLELQHAGAHRQDQ
jgi:crotonobetainyl-CoA:carnitine CoA-transferase CaiB-like acyl-CoA transferase